jgi:hypothetical protein
MDPVMSETCWGDDVIYLNYEIKSMCIKLVITNW